MFTRDSLGPTFTGGLPVSLSKISSASDSVLDLLTFGQGDPDGAWAAFRDAKRAWFDQCSCRNVCEFDDVGGIDKAISINFDVFHFSRGFSKL